jgi:hypothetical protein
MPSHGVSFRDPAALARVLGHVAKRPQRAKQLRLPGIKPIRPRHNGCVACGRQLKRPGGCPDCGAFVCRVCDEVTTRNGGCDGVCLECLVAGREADPRTILEAAE